MLPKRTRHAAMRTACVWSLVARASSLLLLQAARPLRVLLRAVELQRSQCCCSAAAVAIEAQQRPQQLSRGQQCLLRCSSPVHRFGLSAESAVSSTRDQGCRNEICTGRRFWGDQPCWCVVACCLQPGDLHSHRAISFACRRFWYLMGQMLRPTIVCFCWLHVRVCAADSTLLRITRQAGRLTCAQTQSVWGSLCIGGGETECCCPMQPKFNFSGGYPYPGLSSHV